MRLGARAFIDVIAMCQLLEEALSSLHMRSLLCFFGASMCSSFQMMSKKYPNGQVNNCILDENRKKRNAPLSTKIFNVQVSDGASFYRGPVSKLLKLAKVHYF